MEQIRSYTELAKLQTFRERFDYLKLDGFVGVETFGFDRYLNQSFYQSDEWKHARQEVILRDNGCDLGIEGYEICDFRDKRGILRKPKIYIHHMLPILKEQILDRDPIIYNPEFLITTTLKTHNAIHYGDESQIFTGFDERTKNDTCPWK